MSDLEKLKQKLQNKVFYADSSKRKLRKECAGKKCKRYREAGGTVHCGDYVSGWCKSYDENEGVPCDEKCVSFADVLKLLDGLEKTHVIKSRRELEADYEWWKRHTDIDKEAGYGVSEERKAILMFFERLLGDEKET